MVISLPSSSFRGLVTAVACLDSVPENDRFCIRGTAGVDLVLGEVTGCNLGACHDGARKSRCSGAGVCRFRWVVGIARLCREHTREVHEAAVLRRHVLDAFDVAISRVIGCCKVECHVSNNDLFCIGNAEVGGVSRARFAEHASAYGEPKYVFIICKEACRYIR